MTTKVPYIQNRNKENVLVKNNIIIWINAQYFEFMELVFRYCLLQIHVIYFSYLTVGLSNG
jgi:hypothetical protein